ncbi:MAG: TldD/PmbA family protein [Methanosphaera stadtmanae]|jgi:TldD protein|nr:TldD/PmbA family protein [Methanosphaera stadtmanae]
MSNKFDEDIFYNVIKKLGNSVDYADIRVGESINNSIVMKDHNIDNIDSGSNYSIGIRVLQNGAWGFSYTNDINKVNDIAQRATLLANQLSSDVKLCEMEPNEDIVKTKAKINIEDVDVEDKIQLVKEADQAANLDGIVSSNITLSEAESTSLLLSTDGTDIKSKNSRVVLSMNTVASNGQDLQFAHESLGGVQGLELIENADLEKFGRKISEKSISLLDAKSAPSGQFPVIFDPVLTGVFIHEALGHASEADIILRNDSILKNKLGQKIASDLVTVVDDATREDGFGYFAYDVEGSNSNKTTLLENGVFKSVLSSRETAQKLNVENSGNARSNITDKPLVRMSNTYIKPGDSSFDELLENLKDGIYLKGSRGGQVDTGKGQFQFNAVEAYKVEKGQLTDHLKDVSLSGNTLDILQNVTGVGSDFKLSVGYCGKDGQTVPVGDGGPHISISNAIVGGAL